MTSVSNSQASYLQQLLQAQATGAVSANSTANTPTASSTPPSNFGPSYQIQLSAAAQNYVASNASSIDPTGNSQDADSAQSPDQTPKTHGHHHHHHTADGTASATTPTDTNTSANADQSLATALGKTPAQAS